MPKLTAKAAEDIRDDLRDILFQFYSGVDVSDLMIDDVSSYVSGLLEQPAEDDRAAEDIRDVLRDILSQFYSEMNTPEVIDLMLDDVSSYVFDLLKQPAEDRYVRQHVWHLAVEDYAIGAARDLKSKHFKSEHFKSEHKLHWRCSVCDASGGPVQGTPPPTWRPYLWKAGLLLSEDCVQSQQMILDARHQG